MRNIPKPPVQSWGRNVVTTCLWEACGHCLRCLFSYAGMKSNSVRNKANDDGFRANRPSMSGGFRRYCPIVCRNRAKLERITAHPSRKRIPNLIGDDEMPKWNRENQKGICPRPSGSLASVAGEEFVRRPSKPRDGG